MEISFLLGIGLLAGFMAGLFGVGGGVIIVPLLYFIKGMDLKTAFGTSLGALLLPVGIFGCFEYYKAGNMNVKFALIIALAMFLGTYFGAKLVQPMAPVLLKRLYAIFLLLAAGKILLEK